MAMKTIEAKVSEEVYELVKKMAEKGRGRGRGEPEKVTIGEMAGDLISTGAYRRIAANKWAKANAPAPKPKKAKVVKAPKAKKVKAAKKSAPKAPKAKKAKAPKKVKAAKPAPASAAATPAVDPLS